MFFRVSEGKWFERLIVLGIILALAMLAGVTLLTNLAYQRAEAELLVERDRQVTFLSAFRLQSEMAKFSQTLLNLSRTKEIQSLILDEQRQALKQASFQLADFDGGVILLDNFGRVVATEPERPDVMNVDLSGRDYFRLLLTSKKPFFSNAVNDGQNGKAVVVVSVPILDENGQFTGALAGMFRLGEKTVSSFYASIVRLRLGQSGNTFVVDGKGTILYDSASNLVGEPYSSQGSGIPLNGSSNAMRIVNAYHQDIVASYATIPGTSWTLVSEDDWVVLTSPMQKYVNLLLLLVILGILIPAVGLGILWRLRYRELHSRKHSEYEMQVARQMKQKLLPKQIPKLPGWNLIVYHQPANVVSGDFYDFMYLSDGRFMLTLGEINDKGMSAMLKITTLRAALRGAAHRLLSPAEALECSNTLICPEMKADESVSCLYCIFDSSHGNLEFASAGQNLAYHINGKDASELQTTGRPLGLSLDSQYQQNLVEINSGEGILFYNEGVVRIRNGKEEPFGNLRLKINLSKHKGESSSIIESLVDELHDYTSNNWDSEDDLTLLLLERDPEC